MEFAGGWWLPGRREVTRCQAPAPPPHTHPPSHFGVLCPCSFLATVDLIGTQFEDDVIATGCAISSTAVAPLRQLASDTNTAVRRYGSHLAMPLMREAHQKWGSAMTKEQARETLENCMRVLWYRDCRAINKMQFAVITADGVDITAADKAIVLPCEWGQKKMVNPGGHD